MANRSAKSNTIRPKILALAVMSCFAASGAWANPTGPTAMTPGVSFTGLNTGSLQVTTTASKSVIYWQGFSIGSGETTNFQQNLGSSSAVLNRVTTLNNPSLINGVLSSNGQVFLINPSGIAIGPTGSINVAAFVASSLDLSDCDFLSGKLHFTMTSGAGAVENWGNISTPAGGHVYLVGPAVTNGGFITTPQGEAILAAGNRVDLVDTGTPDLAVEIDAPNNHAVNLGHIIAQAGRVGIFAGLIDQQGEASADSAVATDDGKIVFRATQGVNFAAGSFTHAIGPGGGSIDVDAGNVTIGGAVVSNTQSIHASGDVTVAADPASVADLVRPVTAARGGTVLLAYAQAKTPAAARRVARTMLPHFHWSVRKQFRYLNWLWARESGWNRFAYNPYSGAYGIPQAVPGSKMASAGPHWRTNAGTQIRWGLRYIRARYGSPHRAWNHSQAYGWY